jgi:hypothetical protein
MEGFTDLMDYFTTSRQHVDEQYQNSTAWLGNGYFLSKGNLQVIAKAQPPMLLLNVLAIQCS